MQVAGTPGGRLSDRWRTTSYDKISNLQLIFPGFRAANAVLLGAVAAMVCQTRTADGYRDDAPRRIAGGCKAWRRALKMKSKATGGPECSEKFRNVPPRRKNRKRSQPIVASPEHSAATV